MTNRERAYETARKWMPSSEPDSVRLCALMCHIELALDSAVAEAIAAKVEDCARIADAYGKAGGDVGRTAFGIATMIRAVGDK